MQLQVTCQAVVEEGQKEQTRYMGIETKLSESLKTNNELESSLVMAAQEGELRKSLESQLIESQLKVNHLEELTEQQRVQGHPLI